MKNFGLWYWQFVDLIVFLSFSKWICAWWNLFVVWDSDGPSSRFFTIFDGISRLLPLFVSGCCFGIAIVVSSLFSSAAFFSSSTLRSSSGYSCVLWKFSIFFSNSIVLSAKAASFLLTCFSRCSSSLWSHLHRLWFCNCSNRSSL